MNAEYKKAAEKLLCAITDKRLHEPAIWNDILSSVRSGKLRLWEINDEILRIKYFCKEKIERASAFTESDKSGVRFDDLNAYFVEAIKSQDKGYFEAFIRSYEPVLQSRAERFVSHYNLSADDTEDIKQIFLETLWFAFLGYDAADPIPLLQYVKKAAVMRQLDYIRTTKNACTVPTRNGYAELRKVMRIYNSAPELPADARIALAVKETGFAEKKVTELVAVGKACEYPIGIVPAEENESAANGTVADELIEDPSVSLFEEVLRSIYRDNFRTAANKITPKDKQILSLSLGVCFDCFGIFKPNTYAEIALKQGASGEKSIEKKRKAAIEKFAKKLCDMGFCDGVSLKQTDMVLVKEDGEKKVQSVTYAYTPYGEGEAGEIIHTTISRHRFQVIRIAEFDMTGAYAEQSAKIIDNMNGNFIKERFYAIPLKNLPRINSHNAKPRMPFYHTLSTDGKG
jgi:hypothetical protein